MHLATCHRSTPITACPALLCLVGWILYGCLHLVSQAFSLKPQECKPGQPCCQTQIYTWAPHLLLNNGLTIPERSPTVQLFLLVEPDFFSGKGEERVYIQQIKNFKRSCLILNNSAKQTLSTVRLDRLLQKPKSNPLGAGGVLCSQRMKVEVFRKPIWLPWFVQMLCEPWIGTGPSSIFRCLLAACYETAVTD